MVKLTSHWNWKVSISIQTSLQLDEDLDLIYFFSLWSSFAMGKFVVFFLQSLQPQLNHTNTYLIYLRALKAANNTYDITICSIKKIFCQLFDNSVRFHNNTRTTLSFHFSHVITIFTLLEKSNKWEEMSKKCKKE